MAAPRAISGLTVATRVSAAAIVLALLMVFPGAAARANGGLPESYQILLPADRPQQILLATNFGLIISDDGGATWTWTCEQTETFLSSLYSVGPPPQSRLYALSPLQGLAFSDDDSCTWRLAGGTLGPAVATDYFADPTDFTRVLAVASTTSTSGTISQVLASHDGGSTFQAPLFTAPTTGTVVGVETARSDPRRMYVTFYTLTTTAPTTHPKLARSIDGGAQWTTIDLEPMLGTNTVRIIAVDPIDPDVLYLRVTSSSIDKAAVSRDAGNTFTIPVTLQDGTVTAFARLASGTVLVGGIVGVDGVGFRSDDGGMTFQTWAGVPHLRALAERDGKLYAAAKNYTDGWAIGVSTDEGRTFQPLASYEQVTAIRPCVVVACAASCDIEVRAGVWPSSVCPPSQGGDGAAGAGPPANSGCGCTVPPEARGDFRGDGGAVAMAGLSLVLAVRRRRRHGASRAGSRS